MRLSTTLIPLALTSISCATPLPLEHAHNQHKRDVATVYQYETVYEHVTVQALPSDIPASQPERVVTYASSGEPVPEVTISNFAPVWTPPSVSATTNTYVPEASTSATTEVSTPSTSSQVAAGSSSTGLPTVDSDAGVLGVTYSPYTSSGQCKSASDVASDLSKISNYGVIRIYGVDCNQVANVLAGKGKHQKILVGIFDVSNIPGAVKTIQDAVSSTGSSWDDFHTVSVGNELVNNGQATVSQIAEYVGSARSLLRQAGYNGPVISIDTFIAVINNPGLCDISDYMGINAHAFFDGYVLPVAAGPWVLGQVQRVWNACGGKKNVLVTETGWPTQGDSNNLCVPSKINQDIAMGSIKTVLGNDAIFFNAYNDGWKAPGAFQAEQFWGLNP